MSGWKLNNPPVKRLSSLNVRTAFSTPSSSSGRAESGAPPPVSGSAASRCEQRRVLLGRATARQQRRDRRALGREQLVDGVARRAVAEAVGVRDEHGAPLRAQQPPGRHQRGVRAFRAVQRGCMVSAADGVAQLARVAAHEIHLGVVVERDERGQGKSPGAASSAVIIVSSPTLIAPISGPMLPVTSTTSASEVLLTLMSAVSRPAAGHRDALARGRVVVLRAVALLGRVEVLLREVGLHLRVHREPVEHLVVAGERLGDHEVVARRHAVDLYVPSGPPSKPGHARELDRRVVGVDRADVHPEHGQARRRTASPCP